MSGTQTPLSQDERDGIQLAVLSAFAKLRNLYREIAPIFQSYGFTAPSAGVIARDLSEKIEASIVQHCASFSQGNGHCDLCRSDHDWEVKICKDSGLTINQSKQVSGENYIVVNYTADTHVTSIWVLWEAKEELFSPRKPNTNARSLLRKAAAGQTELLYTAPRHPFAQPNAVSPEAARRSATPVRMAKASKRPFPAKSA